MLRNVMIMLIEPVYDFEGLTWSLSLRRITISSCLAELRLKLLNGWKTKKTKKKKIKIDESFEKIFKC